MGPGSSGRSSDVIAGFCGWRGPGSYLDTGSTEISVFPGVEGTGCSMVSKRSVLRETLEKAVTKCPSHARSGVVGPKERILFASEGLLSVPNAKRELFQQYLALARVPGDQKSVCYPQSQKVSLSTEISVLRPRAPAPASGGFSEFARIVGHLRTPISEAAAKPVDSQLGVTNVFLQKLTHCRVTEWPAIT